MYIRDNTASPIPALYIFIPGMSNTYIDSKHFIYNNKMFLSEGFALFNNIDSLSTSEMALLLNELKGMSLRNLSKIELSQFAKYNKDNDMRTIDIKQLLLMFSYRLGDIKMAVSLLQVLAKLDSPARLYYSAASKYISLHEKGLSDIYIRKVLKAVFPDSIVEECIKDFSQPKDIFENYTLSKKIEDMEEDREILGLLKVAKIYKELNDSYKLKNIKQIALRELFNNDL